MSRIAAMTLAAAAGLAGAGIQSQSIAIDLAGGDGTPIAFEQFDTRGGTRQLTDVRVRFQGTLTLEATAQSYSDTFIEAGTWSADVYHNVLLSFFEGEGGDGGVGAPFYGLGGIGILNFTGDLEPGIPGNPPFDPGTPGDPITEFTSDVLDSVVDTDPAFFGYFTGDGLIDGFTGPFFDVVLTPPPGDAYIEVFASELTQVGTLTLEYEYVPAPAGVAALGLGLIAGRRRR